MIKLEKKQVKLVSILIAVIFIGSVVAIALTQTGNIASAASSSNVGVIDMQQIMAAHPDRESANSQMEALQAEVDKDFNDRVNSGELSNDEQKAQYAQQCRDRLSQKYSELLESMMTSIENVVKKIADKKGLSIVIDKAAVIYGGQDITAEVIAELGKK